MKEKVFDINQFKDNHVLDLSKVSVINGPTSFKTVKGIFSGDNSYEFVIDERSDIVFMCYFITTQKILSVSCNNQTYDGSIYQIVNVKKYNNKYCYPSYLWFCTKKTSLPIKTRLVIKLQLDKPDNEIYMLILRAKHNKKYITNQLLMIKNVNMPTNFETNFAIDVSQYNWIYLFGKINTIHLNHINIKKLSKIKKDCYFISLSNNHNNFVKKFYFNKNLTVLKPMNEKIKIISCSSVYYSPSENVSSSEDSSFSI